MNPADLLAREEGKTLIEARGEVVRAGQILRALRGLRFAAARSGPDLGAPRCRGDGHA